ncbi:C2 family cysteine protease, partial [Nocardia alni]|uniref:C2 family cysteine protease n=1 Tax=Nocardia alni TaxID=2815723 RepID=UPI001C23AB09
MTIPRRGGIVAVDLAHLPKFKSMGSSGAGAFGLYGPDHPAPTGAGAHTPDEPGARIASTPDGTAAHGDGSAAHIEVSPASADTRFAGTSQPGDGDTYLGHLTGEPATTAAPTTFEPADGDTYFGEDLLEKLEFELPGTTDVPRARFDETGHEPPALREDERLENLTPAQREALLPVLAVSAALPRPQIPGGGDLLTLVDHNGRTQQLPAAATVRTTRVRPQNGIPYYEIQHNGQVHHIFAPLTSGFAYRPDTPGSESGTLSWNIPGGQARFIGFDESGRVGPLLLPYDIDLAAKAGPGPWRWVKDPNRPTWFRINAPHSVLPELPTLVDRRADPVFGPRGPRPQDTRQGAIGDCVLLADLKALAAGNPRTLREMVHDHGDGTASVRFRVDGRAEWVRVDKRIYVTPGTTTGHFAHHEPGEPLWATLIEKAYAHRFGDGNGFLGLERKNPRKVADTAERLGKGFYQAPAGPSYEAWDSTRNEMVTVEQSSRQQPVGTIQDTTFLHPLRFDTDTLHELVGGDPEFARRVADTYDQWQQALDALRRSTQQQIGTRYQGAPDAAKTAWEEFRGTRDYASPTGFRAYLDTLFPGRWGTEKDSLTGYFRALYSGQTQDRLLSDEFRTATESFAHRIDYALKRGTTVALGTFPYGEGRENSTEVPGLIGGHAYAVLGIERDDSGKPVRLLLENPWDHNGVYPTPRPGIEYRLDPGGSDYVTDAEGIRYRREPDGPLYIILPSGAQYRLDPDGTMYGLDPAGARSTRTADGTEHNGSAAKIPPRGGIVAVDLQHLPKFGAISLSGPGAHALYGPQQPVPATHDPIDDEDHFDLTAPPGAQHDSDTPRQPTPTAPAFGTGFEHLRPREDLPPDQQTALNAHHDDQMADTLLRAVSYDEIDDWHTELNDSYEIARLLSPRRAPVPDIDALRDQQAELAGKDSPSAEEERKALVLQRILSHSDAERRWQRIQDQAAQYRTWSRYLTEHYDDVFDPDVVQHHISLLDGATRGELSLPEPIRVVVPLDEHHAVVDEHGNRVEFGGPGARHLIGTIQRERGFLRAPIGAESARAADTSVRMELVIPPGTRGVYRSTDGTQDLLLARDTNYRITGIDNGSGGTVVHATVEPGSATPDTAPVIVRTRSAEDEPEAIPENPLAPAVWEPVHDDKDPLMAALARVLGLRGVSDIRDRISDYLSRKELEEQQERTDLGNRRQNGFVPDEEWEREQERARVMDRWLADSRRIMATDPAVYRNSADPETADAPLRLAADAFSMNVVSAHPDGRTLETTTMAYSPNIFVRRTAEGHYEIGVTPEGNLFAATSSPRKPAQLSSRTGAVPNIPPPLNRVLASAQIPLLDGVGLLYKYIGENVPIVAKTSIDAPPNARELPDSPQREYPTPVKKMTPEELESHRLFVGEDGKLYRASDGLLFDTTWANNAQEGIFHRAIFVMDEFGNLYAGDQDFGVQHHSSFLGGRTVTAAGEIDVRDGVLRVMSDASGHYQPRPELNDFALDLLRRQGLVLDRNFARHDHLNEPRDRSGEPERQRAEITGRQILLDARHRALVQKEIALGATHNIESALQDPTTYIALQAERQSLASQQADLDHWRSGLDTGVIDKPLQNQIFAHPTPHDADDRIIPPGQPRGLRSTASPVHERASWWREHGRSWWDNLHFEDLSPEFQSRMLTDFPGLAGGEGIPADVRNTLNRKHLQLEIAALADSTAPGPRRRLQNLKNTLTDLHTADLEAWIAAQPSGTTASPVHLLSFDQDAQGRRSSATIAVGHVDTAPTVHWHTLTGTPANHAVITTMQQHAETARTQPDHATVMWIDTTRNTRGPGRPVHQLFQKPHTPARSLPRVFTGSRDRAPAPLAAAVSAFADAHRVGANNGALQQIHLHAAPAEAKSAAPHIDPSLVTIHDPGRATTPAAATGDGTHSHPRTTDDVPAAVRIGEAPAPVVTPSELQPRHTAKTTTRPDGTTIHGDGSTARPAMDRDTAETPPRNNCAPLSLAELRRRTDSPVVQTIETSTPEGITREQLEQAAGSALRQFGDHAAIAQNLRDLGHGHIALVVDAYATTDRYGIGAHAYLLVNDHGTITVVDKALDREHEFPPAPLRELSGTHAILYTPQGLPVQQAPHDRVPAAPNTERTLDGTRIGAPHRLRPWRRRTTATTSDGSHPTPGGRSGSARPAPLGSTGVRARLRRLFGRMPVSDEGEDFPEDSGPGPGYLEDPASTAGELRWLFGTDTESENSAREREDFPEDLGPGPGYLEDQESSDHLHRLFEDEPETTGNTFAPSASRRVYSSAVPPNLAVQQADTIGDSQNTVLIARSGRAVVIGPSDSVLWDGRDINGNALIRSSADPDTSYWVRTELLDHLDWTTGPTGEQEGTPQRDQDGRPVSPVLYYDRGVARLGAGELLPTQPAATAGSVRIDTLTARLVLPENAVRALGLGGPAAAAAMVMHTGPLFATVDSRPVPRQSDARAGTWGDNRVLVSNLGRIASRDPQALVDMFHEYPDGTVGVRFFIDGMPHWTRVDRRLLHDSAGSPMHAGHTDGEPLWAALAQKAYALLRPDIQADTTVSVRPFGEPVHPPPIRRMPSSTITAPVDRLTVVDGDGDLLSIRPGDELHGVDDARDPELLTVWIGDDPAAPSHSVRRDLLGELTVFGPGGDGVYHWQTPTEWSSAAAASRFAGLRRMSPEGATHTPVGASISLDVGIGGEPLLDGNTRVSAQALRELGRSIQRANGPVFGDSGPVPADAAQGRAADCYLIAPLKDISANEPQLIRDMITEYPDGTVAVRFFSGQGAPRWVRITRDLYADAQGRMIYAAHDTNRALWPALVEKAYAVRQGGFSSIRGGMPARAMMELLPPYEVDRSGAFRQPIRGIDLATFLHPMRMGVDTMHELLTEQLGADADSDSVFAFAQRLGRLEPIWTVNREDSVDRFRSFLNYHLEPAEKARWNAEIAAVLDYLGQVGDHRQTVTNSVAQQHVVDLIRFVRSRGDKVLLSTRGFGEGAQNVTAYPGLVGTHAYSLSGVRSGEGGGIALGLQNPWESNPNVPLTMDGLTYGPSGALTLDASQLTKFAYLSIRGGGAHFAFGNSTAPLSNDGIGPEADPSTTAAHGDGSTAHAHTDTGSLDDVRIGATPEPADPTTTREFAEFVSTFPEDGYPDGTKLYLQTRHGEVRATFNDGRVTVAYVTDEQPPSTRRRTGHDTEQSDPQRSTPGPRRRSPIAVGTHTLDVFRDKLTRLSAGSIQQVRVAPAAQLTEHTDPASPAPTTFEPEDGDTYFGDMFDHLGFDPTGTTTPQRTHFDDTGIEPPVLPQDERLENLTPEQRQTLLPVVAVPVQIPHHTVAGSNAVTLVEDSGAVHHLPAFGARRASLLNSQTGDFYYDIEHPDGTHEIIPHDLTDGFTFQRDSATAGTGILSWNIPRSETRIAARDETNQRTKVHVPAGYTITARAGSGSSRWIKLPGNPAWYRVTAPGSVLPLPELAERHDTALFGPRGPQPQDARQVRGYDCDLIAPLKHMAAHNPQTIRNMLHDHGDGTVSVRFRVNGAMVWDRHEKSIYVTPGTASGHFVAHEAGEPLWASIIEKAYAHRFGAEEGYQGMSGGFPGKTAERLGTGFHEAEDGWRRQPVRTVDDPFFLSPLHFDADTLHELLGGDFEFSRAVADTFDHWKQERDALRRSTNQQIQTTHQGDAAARKAAWDEFLQRQDLLSRKGLRKYLDRRFPGRWRTEKNTLANYLRRTRTGPAKHRVMSGRYRIAAQAIGNRIDHALQRGTTVVLGTSRFGQSHENRTAVPGLAGSHAYAVLGVERDETGAPARLLLENPWDHSGIYPTPHPGIEYRLDPEGGPYTLTTDGARFRHALDGTMYKISADGAEQFRRDPDGTTYHFTRQGNRQVRTPDGTQDGVRPDGLRRRRTPDGTEYVTSPTGVKMVKRPGDTTWSADPGRVDPPDTTIPRRGGVVAVDLEHLPKFSVLSLHGPGALWLYNSDHATNSATAVTAPQADSDTTAQADAGSTPHVDDTQSDDLVYDVVFGDDDANSAHDSSDDDENWKPDSDGVVRFDYDVEASSYGQHRLRVWDDLSQEQQTALEAFEQTGAVNNLPRRNMSDEQLARWIDELRATAELRDLLSAPHDTEPEAADPDDDAYSDVMVLLADSRDNGPGIVEFHQRRAELRALGSRKPAEEREFDELDKLLSGPDPAARWKQIRTDADNYRSWDEAYRRHFGQGLAPDVLRQHLTALDEAAAREIPLTTPIRVIRDLKDIDFLKIDRDGTLLADQDPRLLVGVPQREPGFLATWLAARDETHRPGYRLELVVPPGTRGVYIGSDGNTPFGTELVLPRDTNYRITGVEHEILDGVGVVVLRGTVEPSPVAEDDHTAPVPIHDPANESHLEDGIRHFPTDIAGDRFGVQQLDAWDQLPHDVRETVRAHAEMPVVNSVLESISADYEIDTRIGEYTRNTGIDNAVAEYSGDLVDMARRRDELDAENHRTADEERERRALHTILSDASPKDRYEQISSDAWTYRRLAELYTDILHQDFRPSDLPHHIARLDHATSRELPLTEPIRVVHAIDGISSLAKDEHGLALDEGQPEDLIGVLQHQRGYLSTSLRPDPNSESLYLMELVVPPGTRGIYLGRKGPHQLRNELLLARNTPYRITGVERRPDGVTVLRATVEPPPATDHGQSGTTQFEPEDGDTYFGDAMLTHLGFELPGTPTPQRTHFDRTGLDPPTLTDDQRLENLTPDQRKALLPTLGIPVRVPEQTAPGGGDGIVIATFGGDVIRLPATGSMPATQIKGPTGRTISYEVQTPTGGSEWLMVSMVPDFTFQNGTLSWDKPASNIRLNVFDSNYRMHPLHMKSGTAAVMRSSGYLSGREIKFPGNPEWYEIDVPHDVLPELPKLVERHADPLFGPGGPKSQDARQGKLGDCALIAVLKQRAARAPRSIEEMLTDHGDGTVSVRFFVDGKPEWVRVEKSIYVKPGTQTGYFAGHDPGEPLWAGMIEKAYVQRFGRGEGYFEFYDGGTPGHIAERLGKGFHQAEATTTYRAWNTDQDTHVTVEWTRPQQPVRNTDDGYFLYPLQFDVNTLNDLLNDYLRANPPDGGARAADPEFARQIADTHRQWMRDADAQHDAEWKRIEAAHPGDRAAARAELDTFRETDYFRAPSGFAKYLDAHTNEPSPHAWDAEKDALKKYFDHVRTGKPENRLLPDPFAVAGRAIADRIDYALRHGDTVVLGTAGFGQSNENVTAVPGLVGNHAYAVLGVERDHAARPARILLENPWDHQPRYGEGTYFVPDDGIEYRLDPDGVQGYKTDFWGERFRTTPDGILYRITTAGVHSRRDPDGTVYTVEPNGTRTMVAPDGTQDRVSTSGRRTRWLPDGTVLMTDRHGNKLIQRPGDAEFSSEARVDPPDMTIPRRGGIIAVRLDHLSKFANLAFSGSGAHGLYESDHPAIGAGARPASSPTNGLGADPAHDVTPRSEPDASTDPAREDSSQEWELDSDGIPRFDYDTDAVAYGRRTLRVWNDLSADERNALLTFESSAAINNLPRRNMSDEDLARWIDELRATNDLHELLTDAHLGYANLADLRDRRVELRAQDRRTPVEQRELDELDTLLSGPDPAAHWTRIRTDADNYRSWDDTYHQHFGRGLSPDMLRQHLRMLDGATAREIPLTTPIRVTRDLKDIGFLKIDRDGTPLRDRDPRLLAGVTQREPGFLSTSIKVEQEDQSAEHEYRLELVVPPGTRGVHIGADGNAPFRREIVLPRDTNYRITSVEYDPAKKVVVLHGTVEPSPVSEDDHTATPPAPIHDPANESHLEDGIRHFPTDIAGDRFGVQQLDAWDQLPPDVRETVRAHAARPIVNVVLGSISSDDQIDTRVDEYARNAERHHEMSDDFGNLELMADRRDRLAAQDRRTEAEERERRTLHDILSDDSPRERLARLATENWAYRELTELYTDHLHQDFRPGDVRHHIARLDRATDRELPLTEPIRVVHALDDISSLVKDEHGTALDEGEPEDLIGTLQHERGYLSTSLRSDPNSESLYLMELVVPPGTRGIYLGRKGPNPFRNELMLARNTPYRITGVERRPDGVTILRATVEPPATTPMMATSTTQFEPEDGDTYFGDAMLDHLGFELPGTPTPQRTHFDRTGLDPPTLTDDQRLENLTPDQKKALLPRLGIPVRMPAQTLPGGGEALTISAHGGEVLRLPASGSMPARRNTYADGSIRSYEITKPDGGNYVLAAALAQDFTYHDGTLTWDAPSHNRIRILATDSGKQRALLHLKGEQAMVARSTEDALWREMKYPGATEWYRVKLPVDLLPQLPTLVERHRNPLFGPQGPKSQDARQGNLGDCPLIAALKQRAVHNPRAIEEMLTDHGDGTVSVRFFVDGVPEWVRVEKSIYVAPGTQTGYFAGHNPGEPLWASMIEKAYVHRFGKDQGYFELYNGGSPGRIAGRLGKGFHEADDSTTYQAWDSEQGRAVTAGHTPRQQPVRTAEDVHFLHPLQFDTDTLHELLNEYLLHSAPHTGRPATTADPEFSRRIADTYTQWRQQADTLHAAESNRIAAAHPNDPAAARAEWDKFERTDDPFSPSGFGKYLDARVNEPFPHAWDAEKDALTSYFSEVMGTRPYESRSLPTGMFAVAGRAVADRIDYTLRRGDTATLGTGWFGQDRENVDAIPGLVGGHVYAVLGVERDETGAPVRILLENPWDHPARHATGHYLDPVDGIEYRLDPLAGADYVIGYRGDRYRYAPDGTRYGITVDGVHYREDRDRTRYTVEPNGTRSMVAWNGTVDRVSATGSRTRWLTDGTTFRTEADGTKLVWRPGDTAYSPDIRVDPPDMTVPRRGGIIAVGLAHLPKFSTLALSGPGAHGLYQSDHPALTDTGSRLASSPADESTPETRDTTSQFEPEDGDTYFGSDLLEKLETELTGLSPIHISAPTRPS